MAGRTASRSAGRLTVSSSASRETSLQASNHQCLHFRYPFDPATFRRCLLKSAANAVRKVKANEISKWVGRG